MANTTLITNKRKNKSINIQVLALPIPEELQLKPNSIATAFVILWNISKVFGINLNAEYAPPVMDSQL